MREGRMDSRHSEIRRADRRNGPAEGARRVSRGDGARSPIAWPQRSSRSTSPSSPPASCLRPRPTSWRPPWSNMPQYRGLVEKAVIREAGQGRVERDQQGRPGVRRARRRGPLRRRVLQRAVHEVLRQALRQAERRPEGDPARRGGRRRAGGRVRDSRARARAGRARAERRVRRLLHLQLLPGRRGRRAPRRGSATPPGAPSSSCCSSATRRPRSRSWSAWPLPA